MNDDSRILQTNRIPTDVDFNQLIEDLHTAVGSCDDCYIADDRISFVGVDCNSEFFRQFDQRWLAEFARRELPGLIPERGCPFGEAEVSVLDIARDLTAHEISVIPIRCDGSKAPACKWSPYRSRLATDEELCNWFSEDQHGIGLVCGVPSRGLEVLDFDHDSDATFNAWRNQLPPTIRNRLTVVETGGGGYHAIYRCDVVSGNIKIAMASAGEVKIESRGEGGYVVGVGSPLAVHNSGNPYVQVAGVSLPKLPLFTPDERCFMWKQAAAFDERDRKEVAQPYIRQVLRRKQVNRASQADPNTPWGHFDSAGDWLEILEPHGWTSSNGVHWTRPGKHFGTSAKLCLARDGTELLTVFSSNAGPLAPSVGSHISWSKFGAYAALNHDGNRQAAARDLVLKGYGRRSTG